MKNFTLRLGTPVNQSTLPLDMNILLSSYKTEFVPLIEYNSSPLDENDSWTGVMDAILDARIDTPYEQFYLTLVSAGISK
jgi:hypothetical protein